MLLLSRQLRLEAYPLEPLALGETHLRDFLDLAIIKLAKKRLLNLVNVLDVHLFFRFLNVKQLQKRVGASSLPVLLHVSLQNLAQVLLAELIRVNLCGH